MIAYSGGLHHIQTPGQLFPRLFKRVDLVYEIVDIADFKKPLLKGDFRSNCIKELERRRDAFCPQPQKMEEPLPLSLPELEKASAVLVSTTELSGD